MTNPNTFYLPINWQPPQTTGSLTLTLDNLTLSAPLTPETITYLMIGGAAIAVGKAFWGWAQEHPKEALLLLGVGTLFAIATSKN
jgi:hypothetical protein